MKHSLAIGLLLSISWLLWSGHFGDELLLGFGAGSCGVVVLLIRRMRILDHEGQPLELGLRPLTYAPWLIKQILTSNLDVMRRVLHPRLPIAPRLIEINASQSSELGQVVYANSITLTPGTISIRIRDGVILVHALTPEAAEDLQSGEMDRRVTRMEGMS